MVVSSILRKEASLEEEVGRGSTAAVELTYSSVVGSLKVGRGGGALKEDSTLGCLELALCRRNVAPIGAIICTSLEAGNLYKPKCNKI